MKSAKLLGGLVGGLAAIMLPWVLLAYAVGVLPTLLGVMVLAALLGISIIVHHVQGESSDEW